MHRTLKSRSHKYTRYSRKQFLNVFGKTWWRPQTHSRCGTVIKVQALHLLYARSRFIWIERQIHLKARTTVAYPVHIVLLNCSGKHRRYSIDYSHKFVGFLLVSTAEQKTHSKIDNVFECGFVYGSSFVVPVADEMPQNLQANGRDVVIVILHEAKQKNCTQWVLLLKLDSKLTFFDNVWKCNPVVTSYCCDRPEGKDVSAGKHGTTARSCVQCVVSWNNMKHSKKENRRDGRSMQDVYTESERLEWMTIVSRKSPSRNKRSWGVA